MLAHLFCGPGGEARMDNLLRETAGNSRERVPTCGPRGRCASGFDAVAGERNGERLASTRNTTPPTLSRDEHRRGRPDTAQKQRPPRVHHANDPGLTATGNGGRDRQVPYDADTGQAVWPPTTPPTSPGARSRSTVARRDCRAGHSEGQQLYKRVSVSIAAFPCAARQANRLQYRQYAQNGQGLTGFAERNYGTSTRWWPSAGWRRSLAPNSWNWTSIR